MGSFAAMVIALLAGLQVNIPQASQLAQAGSPDTSMIDKTSKDCQSAIQLAISGIYSGSQSGTGLKVQDKCLAAVFYPSFVHPGELNPKNNPKNYQCVGKMARITIDTNGLVTEDWVASASVQAGYCSVVYCDTRHGCKPAELQAATGAYNNAPDVTYENTQAMFDRNPSAYWTPLNPDMQAIPSPTDPRPYVPREYGNVSNDLVYHPPTEYTTLDNATAFNGGSMTTLSDQGPQTLDYTSSFLMRSGELGPSRYYFGSDSYPMDYMLYGDPGTPSIPAIPPESYGPSMPQIPDMPGTPGIPTIPSIPPSDGYIESPSTFAPPSINQAPSQSSGGSWLSRTWNSFLSWF